MAFLQYFIAIMQLLSVCLGKVPYNQHDCESQLLNNNIVNCSNKGLTKYPLIHNGEHLDLSHNHIQEFPMKGKAVESLTFLDLSYNKFREVSVNAFTWFQSLRVINLANNNIQSWSDINPSIAFKSLHNLQKLSLAGNHLNGFSSNDGATLLKNDVLTELDISHCQITQVDNFLSGLPSLERLSLSGNNLKDLTLLSSKSLRDLDISNCSLKSVNSSLIDGLPNLEVLNVSWNRGVTIGSSPGEIMKCETLRQIDMSFCNLNSIILSGMPNLMVVLLKGNMLSNISSTMFANNTALKMLDLSQNVIRQLDGDAFFNLRTLIELDLSANKLVRYGKSQFRNNDALESINLNQNKFKKLSKFISYSLRSVNFSRCEISQIDPNAFSGLRSLISLDLSYNLISEFPLNMNSKTLRRLDLSMCRLSEINNATFHDLPALASLKLSSNQFKTPFRAEYFKSNMFLSEIWLGDNHWHCDCNNRTFKALYDYLTKRPQKLQDKTNVRCFSPLDYYGRTWEAACMGNANNMIIDVILIILVIYIAGCYLVLIIVSCFKKYSKIRIRQEVINNEEQPQEEPNVQILERGAQQNAADPMESMPPSYEDALLMAKPERSNMDCQQIARRL